MAITSTTYRGRPVPATPERRGHAISGWLGLLIEIGILAGIVLSTIFAVVLGNGWFGGLAVLLTLVFLVVLNGFFILQPNQAEVLIFFGKYNGTITHDGWFLANPLNVKRKISLRVNNFNTDQMKVNESGGNPIEIGAVVVWRVVDTARATFDVEDYVQFVHVQAETAVRHLAQRYPYDEPEKPEGLTLRGATEEVSGDLRTELQSRLNVAGVQIMEARLTHLAYSPEIAQAMLQRQAAAAIVAARKRIVAGAVGMVEDALNSLRSLKIVALTTEQKARLVSDLMVVLTSDRGAQPVLQTGGSK